MFYRIKKSIIIPPYYGSLILGIFFLSMGIAIRYCRYIAGLPGYESGYPSIDINLFIIVISVLLIFTACFHFSLHEDCIWIRFLWIPVRKIRWEKIATAHYLHKWTTGYRYGDKTGYGIMVTLGYSRFYKPERDGVDRFIAKHPFSSFFIRFTPKHRQEYFEMFQRHFPDIQVQEGMK